MSSSNKIFHFFSHVCFFLPPLGKGKYSNIKTVFWTVIILFFFFLFSQSKLLRWSIWRWALYDNTAQFLWMCPRGLSPEDLGVISSILLTGGDCLRKKQRDSICHIPGEKKAIFTLLKRRTMQINCSYCKPFSFSCPYIALFFHPFP